MMTLIKQLSCCNKNSYKGIIKHANKIELRDLLDFVKDVFAKKVPISNKTGKLIRRNRHALLYLLHPKYSLRSKRKYLIQKGGGSEKGFGSAMRSIAKAAEEIGRGAIRGARDIGSGVVRGVVRGAERASRG